MQCYTELLPPTGVTHALKLPFLSADANNLAIARTSVLQIFTLKNIPSQSDIDNERSSQPSQEITKLVLEKEYHVPGTITGLSRVRVLDTKSGGEAILLSFRNAKLSLIEWDPERYGISTISVHYYERDDLTRSPWAPDLNDCGSILSVDPGSRCAIFNFGIHNLAIIPFHQPGDDLVMDDYDTDEDNKEQANREGHHLETPKANLSYQTPYGPSFVLPLTALDPSIVHPISLTFLYEYREPTFGILYSQVATSNALLHERKDVVFYAVFQLDLEQRASTMLLSVSRLPSDLFKVVALPPPVGGALLIGSNELVHVDQAGKTNAVGVNEFSRQVSTFSMADQSDLALRLEGCAIERLSDHNGDLLLVLSSGSLVLVTFKLDGRSVSGISVSLVPPHTGGNIMKSAASCSTFISDGRVFFGSEDAESVLLGWSRSVPSVKKLRSQVKHTAGETDGLSEEEQSENESYEDDLYSTVPEVDSRRLSTETSASGAYQFRKHDRLFNIGPLRDFTLGKTQKNTNSTEHSVKSVSAELDLVAAQGTGESGGLVVMNREVDPLIISSMTIESANRVWAARVAHKMATVPNNLAGQNERQDWQHFVIISKPKSSEKEISEVFQVEGQTLKPFKAPEFNPNEDITIDIGTLESKNRVVQVLKNEVRSYEIDMGLAQIYPVWDEDTSDERVAVSASFVDPYIAILRDDATLLLLQADDSGDLDEAVLNSDITGLQWLSCCLYCDKTGIFSSDNRGSESTATADMLLFLLSADCRLFIYRLSDQKLISVIEGLDCFSPILSDEPPKRSTAREVLVEAVVADLGDAWDSSPYLILRTENDDLAVYRPFITSVEPGNNATKLNFIREPSIILPNTLSNPEANRSTTESRKAQSLRVLTTVSGLKAVFMPGHTAGFVCKTAASAPHFLRLRSDYTGSLSSIDTPMCEKGFVYLDSKNVVRMCQLPEETQFDYPWTLRRVPVGNQIDHLAYSSASNTYVLGTSQATSFHLPEDDELHPEWRSEGVTFLPQVPLSWLKVMSPKTWTIIDSYELGSSEHITAVKSMSLEVSENTHERREMIVVGTALVRGEDIPSRGCVYVFEVIQVVPDPEAPETDRKLKLIGKEVVKGAVTSLSEIGGQGFLMVAQGQKCMVRGLKEDGSLLPVAFMDMQCYVNVAKELKGTGMCILGDAVRGLWFAGYSEEPYKMSLFAKDLDYLDVLAADFLPDGDKLYIVVADSDCNLHILQYDPEDPKSSNGDRLLNRSKFHTGSFASTVTLLPRTAVSSERITPDTSDTSSSMDLDIRIPQYQVLTTSQNGSIGLITSVSEEPYRRLSALQSQLTNILEHPCGLNPRAYRAVESDGSTGRGMLDGNLLAQWLGLSKQRKTEIAGRVGAQEWEIRADLEAVGGDGLGYL